jgi:hypothetical protein
MGCCRAVYDRAYFVDFREKAAVIEGVMRSASPNRAKPQCFGYGAFVASRARLLKIRFNVKCQTSHVECQMELTNRPDDPIPSVHRLIESLRFFEHCAVIHKSVQFFEELHGYPKIRTVFWKNGTVVQKSIQFFEEPCGCSKFRPVV